ncbi:MAG: 5-dehydro-2-deoxygluconokinase [Acidimicrobiia bacterium]
MSRAADRYDLIAMGRVGVDLYPLQSGVPLSEVSTFAKSLGGSPTNVAVAAARYGHRVALITKVGNDPFGVYVKGALSDFGVDYQWVSTDPRLRTPIVFCELFPPDRFPILFYREPKAPDMNLEPSDLPDFEIASARIVWTTGTGLADHPSRGTTMLALEARSGRAITIHDLDFRPSLWPNPSEAADLGRKALTHATVAVGNCEECAVVVGEASPQEQALRMRDQYGLELAIVKLGREGVLAAWGDTWEQLPPVPVEVVNGLGAGDAFGGALCHGLLQGWDTIETIRFASAAGAYVAARLACADAMPTEEQVRSLLATKEEVS